MAKKATCSVCLRQHVLGSRRIVRHGFSIHTKGHGHGHLGAWHSGPCFGADYPHLGVSCEGTKVALAQVKVELQNAEGRLARLKKRPELPYQASRTVYPTLEERRAGKSSWTEYKTFTVKPGAEAKQDWLNDGWYVSEYESLLRHELGETEQRIGTCQRSIATYEVVIATWSPEKYPVIDEAAKGPTLHRGVVSWKWKRQGKVPACQQYAMRPPTGLVAATEDEVNCKRCGKGEAK